MKKTKNALAVIALLMAVSCARTYTKLNTNDLAPTPAPKTESLINGVDTPHYVNSKTVFEDDAVERYDENSYLTLTFRGKKMRFRISTNPLEQQQLINKNTPINDNVGLLFAYDKPKLPCICNFYGHKRKNYKDCKGDRFCMCNNWNAVYNDSS